MDQEKSSKAESHYYSDRLKRKLDKLRLAPVAVVEAPSGYGKTTAIRDCFENMLPRGTPVYWFTATEEDPAAAYRRLCREIEKADRNVGARLQKIGLPNAVTIGEATDALRSIRCICEVYLVIDNFQLIDDYLPFAFIRAIFEHGGEGLHVIIMTQMLKRNVRALIKCHGLLYIDAADLRLNSEDIRCYYSCAGLHISIEDAREVEKYTEGWIIAVYLQLCAYRETGKLSGALGILELMESLVWDALMDEQKLFLLYLSPFEVITVQQACTLIGCSTLPEYALNALGSPFIHYDLAEQQYELHSILADLIIKKRREYGALFECRCLLIAGDFCRDVGNTSEAISFYTQIKDYERILSLDLSQMAQDTMDNKSFGELALDIALKCPLQIKKSHILSMLHIAWSLRLSELMDNFEVLMKALYDMPELQEDSYLLGEWMLLSTYISFPDIIKMDEILKQAAPLFEGKCSRVILPTAPWCFGNYSPFAEFYTRQGEADLVADKLEEYIAVYSRLTNGHGSGADVLFCAELAYQRGNLKEAEILAYKVCYIAENKKQSVVQLGATMQLAEIALHKADTEGWQHSISSMERAVSLAPQNNNVIQPVLDIIKGVLLGELQFQKDIAEWLQNGDFSKYPLSSDMKYNAMFVHLFYLMQQGEHERLIGTVEAMQMEHVRARPFADQLFCLVAAVSHLSLGDRSKALELVEHAAKRGLPDGLIFIFASFSVLLQGLTDEIIKEKYPLLLKRFDEVKKRFTMGWSAIHEVISPDEIPSDLTPREYEVAKLAALGLHNNEIAEELTVTESTVRTHLRTVFQKLQIDRRGKLAEKLK